MTRRQNTILIVCIAGLIAASLEAQSVINPNLSIIPRFKVESTDQGGKFSQPDYSFEELEMAIDTYLNPFARADVVLTLPGPDLETGKLGVEEIYASIVRGLPLDMNIRLGKYRAEFGKLNLMHPHAWPFVSRPLMQERFFGESLNDLGISASILLPTGDVYTRLTVDLLRGTAVREVTGLSDTLGGKPLYANSARLSSFFTLDDYSDLETGLSAYTGIHDPYSGERFWYVDVDAKFKYAGGVYTSFTLQGEYLFSTRMTQRDGAAVPLLDGAGNPAGRRVQSGGLYLFANLQFAKVYTAGVRYDWAQTPYDSGDRASGAAVFLGFYPVEETLGFRFEYNHRIDNVSGVSASVNTLALQVLFSLGPHKAHPF